MRRLRLTRLSLAILLVAVLQAGGGNALAHRPDAPAWRPYHWPIKPFATQHPVQAVLGDPRTLYAVEPFGRTGPNREGAHSFHNGVDIPADSGTPVYPVASGRVALAIPDEIVVRTGDSRTFQYYHLDSAVKAGQWVVAQQTILGTIKPKYLHVHLAEIDRGHLHNPLDYGHLSPYRDRTRPRAAGLYINNGGGPRALVGGHVGARDRLVVAASDPPALPMLGPYSGLPQIPALVEWRLLRGHSHTAWKIAGDFRLTAPPPRSFWQVYAPGTYQNCPVFERRYFSATPGRYLFRLELAASRLAVGWYRLQVRVTDIRANTSTAAWPLRIGPVPRLDV